MAKKTAAVVEAEPEVVAVEPETWPEAAAHPGDREQLTVIRHRLEAITDVGSLAGLCEAVLARAKAERVRPEVLAAIVKPYAGGVQ